MTATATTTAASVVRAAVDVATELGSKVVGQEHVILAIGDRPESLGGAAFAAVGVDPGSIRNGLLAMMGAIRPAPSTPPAPTPRLQLALEQADAEATERDRPTTSADLLIGILRSHVGVGFQLLGYAGVTEAALRDAVAGVLPGHPELDTVEQGVAAASVLTA
jgi:ATP-dependent Clp protease ATP-binding subunit ClpA